MVSRVTSAASVLVVVIGTLCAVGDASAAFASRSHDYPSAWRDLPRPDPHYKPHPDHERPCGEKVCHPNGVCEWSGCGDCETCKWGKCVEKECPPCHTCDGGECTPDCDEGECVRDRWHGYTCKPETPDEKECKHDWHCHKPGEKCVDGVCVGDMTCEGKPGKALEEDGSCPEAECFNDAHLGQVVLASGSLTTGAHWTVGIKQCLQKAGKIGTITWAYAEDGMCPDTVDCAGNKAKKVEFHDTFIEDLTVPAGMCSGTPICVYLRDGAFRKGDHGTPQPGIPERCYSKDEHLCKTCGPYLVTPKLPEHSECTPVDTQECVTGTCDKDGECSVLKPNDEVCKAKYNPCAQPECDADATGDGCMINDVNVANKFCADKFPSGCGVATCDLEPLTDGTGTGLEGSGCSLSPNPDLCTVGKPVPCATATCSDAGTCTYHPDDSFCQNPDNFGPTGGYGPCVTAECDLTSSSDTGCIATVDASQCTVPSGGCGTSTCKEATGACELSSDIQTGQCQACQTCVNNQCSGPTTCPTECAPACGLCEVCDDTMSCQPQSQVYDMVCYKCGNDINCVIKADQVSDKLRENVRMAIQSNCDTDRNTCDQPCTRGNPNSPGTVSVIAQSCFPKSGEAGSLGGSCPCSGMAISNFAGYKVHTHVSESDCVERVTCDAAIPKCDAEDGDCMLLDEDNEDCEAPPANDSACSPRLTLFSTP